MLSPADRSRIEKLANLLASTFDGERANAGALLARMAAERKLTVAGLLGLAQVPPAPEPRPRTPPPSSSPWWESGDLLDHLAQAVKYYRVLTSWEKNFASDVSRRCATPDRLTDKQKAVAQRIVAKARRAALAGVRA